jgi:hypothetical protein
MITIDELQTDVNAILNKIAAFAKQAVQPVYPVAVSAPDLWPGERLVGTIITADGSRRYHLTVFGEDFEPADWNTQMERAKAIGGELFDRVEGALLAATMKDEFKEQAYWTRERHAAVSDYAWFQRFGGGDQGDYHINGKLPARAGRRLPI